MTRNMKHKDFKSCHLCRKGVMHAGHPLFLQISVDRLGVDWNAVRRTHGIELMMSGNALLANIMGPNKDIAKVIDGNHDLLICMECAGKPLPLYFWLAESEAA